MTDLLLFLYMFFRFDLWCWKFCKITISNIPARSCSNAVANVFFCSEKMCRITLFFGMGNFPGNDKTKRFNRIHMEDAEKNITRVIWVTLEALTIPL
ncbi:MAG: hypothetical protein A2283_15785 [Lentisphaerae bacterium RIFOXYA12_FULL_48_11]|nr:MAG: hypothetical protein A2283_15785 [Lentisphaerae bacterium RIFOXYA12_FULL_48_11]